LLEPVFDEQRKDISVRTTIAPFGGVSTRGRRSRWLTLSGAAAVAAALTLGTLVPGASPAAADSAPADPTAITSPKTVTADALPAPQIDGVVWDQVVAGNTVYVGGNFTSARPAGSKAGTNETPRSNFLAYDLHTGALLPYAPTFNASVETLTVSPDGKRLYVGGLFSKVNGTDRYRLAAFDLPSGDLVAGFQPYMDSRVQAVVATNTTVFVGGVFTTVSKDSRASSTKFARTQTAAFSATDATVLPWAPKLTGGFVKAMVISPDASKIVLGGKFRSLNGSTMPGTLIGAVDTNTGTTALPWGMNATIPNGGAALDTAYDYSIYSLNADGQNVYGTMGPANFEGTFKASWADGKLGWIADCHGDTYSVQPVGDVVYTASHAHDCGNARSFADYLAPYKWYRALALTTAATQTTRAEDDGYKNFAGQPSPTVLEWYPAFNTGTKTGTSQGPWDVTAAQGYVLYGGEFTQVNEKGQQGLVRFALPDKAPNKIAPSLAGADMKPSVTSFGGTYVKLSWPTNYDWDNENLTYQVIRNGDTAKPVFTTTQSSRFWQRGTLRGNDGPLTPGATYSYQIRTVDPFGNATMSDAVSYTATAATAQASLWTSYDKTVLQDQPAAYWPMNEGAGGVGYDWVGANDMAVIPTFVAETKAGAGTAAAFDGATQYSVAGEPLEPPGSFSQELWFKTSARHGGVMMGMGSSSWFGPDSMDRQLYMTDSGVVRFASITNDTMMSVGSKKPLNDGGWHHVLVTVGASGASLFIDGVLNSTRADQTTGHQLGGRAFWNIGGHTIGGRPENPSTGYFEGAIDNVATYHRAVPASFALSHYQAGAAIPNVNPVASFTASAKELAVSVDASGSSDADGKVASYAWTFGDGSTGTGVTASHTFAKAGTYTVGLTVTDDRGGKSTVSKSVTVSTTPVPPVPPVPSTTIAEDAFERSVASGWSSATVGGAWKVSSGSTASVGNGSGVLTSVKGQTSAVSLPAVVSDSSDSVVSFRLNNAPTGGGQYVAVTGRQVGSDSYVGRVWVQSNGVLQLQIQRSGTIVSSVNLTGVTYKAGDVINLRFQVTGVGTTTLSAKAWTTGAEPAAWTRTIQDTTAALQAPGTVGLGLYVSSTATAPSSVSFDNYVVKKVAP
jgi:PKD repeat protein